LTNQSSRWALVLWPKTSKTLFDQQFFHYFFLRCIRTCKFKLPFPGLQLVSQLSRFILNWSQDWLKLSWHCPNFPGQILKCLSVSFFLDTFYSVSILLDYVDKGGLTQKLLKFPYGKTFVRNMYYFIEHFWHKQKCVET
jgi:hypothetical protein